jgi:hypothetical protein
MCPFECELCKRLCANPDHLHGLEPDAVHLCGFVFRVVFHNNTYADHLPSGRRTRVLASAQQMGYARLTQLHNP